VLGVHERSEREQYVEVFTPKMRALRFGVDLAYSCGSASERVAVRREDALF